jgi:isochorismate synthase
LYFAENFEEVGFIFAPLKAAKDTNSFDQSVKWSALLTSEETRNLILRNLKINKIKNILNRAKGIDSIHEGFSKKVVVSRKEIIETDSFSFSL